MESSSHTYRVTLSWWIGNVFIGSFISFIVFFILLTNAQDFISGKYGVSDYLGVALLVFLILPLGLMLLTFPFVTKIVVQANGLEYYTTTYILIADWRELINVGHIQIPNVGKTMVVVPRGGKLTLRKWAQPFRSILKHNPEDIEIFVSQFRESGGHSLETDILVNIAQHGTLPVELESR